MKILKINRNKLDQRIINEAAAILKRGGVIVYPTDTAYALGGIFNSPRASARILKIKNRKDEKFTIITSSLNQVEKFFKLNARQKKLAKKYWPGPLSIVVSERFAVRVPNNLVAQTLARRAGKPLIATSANLTGEQTLYGSGKIIRQFKNKKNQPDLILAVGRLLKVKTSTIVLLEDEKIKILRQGSIKV